MSIAASLNDLGAVTASRAGTSARPRAEAAGTERDDAFGQMLRDAARTPDRSPPEAPGRDQDWRAGRAQNDKSRPDDRPDRDKPDLPAAALEHRSENARRGGGPRDPESRKAESAKDDTTARAAKKSDCASPGKEEEAVASDAKTVESETKAAEPSPGADAPAAPTLPVQAADQAKVAVAMTLLAPTTDATPTMAAPEAPADGAAPIVAATQTTATAAPAVQSASDGAAPATPSNSTNILAEAAPALVESADGQTPAMTQTTDAASSEAEAAAQSEGMPAAKHAPQTQVAAGGQATLPDKALEALAAAHEKTKGSQGAEHGKALGRAKHGEATAEAVPAAPQTAPSGPAAQASATAHAVAAALEPTQGGRADGAQQPASPTLPGAVTAPTPASDARVSNPVLAAQRHDMPVPMQAVAIEIGMRAMRGAKEFAIRLDPEDLGRVDVKLEISEAGQVQAKVVVDKVETLQLLQRDARTLERAFDQAGLKTTPDGLQFSLRDSGGQNRNGGDQPSRDNSRGGRVADEPMIDEIRLQPAQYRLAATSGLDIRI